MTIKAHTEIKDTAFEISVIMTETLIRWMCGTILEPPQILSLRTSTTL